MQMYVNYYTREMMNEGDSPSIGILLCEIRSVAVVRYTLPEGGNQILASRYKLYLPTEEELRAELIKDRQLIEQRREPYRRKICKPEQGDPMPIPDYETLMLPLLKLS